MIFIMNSTTRQLLRDLKAAAVLGNPEAVDMALTGLLFYPGVAANDRMDEGFIEGTILPVGKSLRTLRTSYLRPLLRHRLAAGRAVGAAALAHQFIEGKNATPKDLKKPANDPRADVRFSLGRALATAGTMNSQRRFDLCAAWLKNPAPKARHTALIVVPALAESHAESLIEILAPVGYDHDQEVRAVLVDALRALGGAGLAESVLELLGLWAGEKRPNAWVISRVLSASWAAGYPSQAEAILRNLASKGGNSSQVKSAVEALARHGLEINL